MEFVKNLDDLMLQINGVNPNEATMKVFNVLFPYPKKLPLGEGDESSLAGFFDGMTKNAKDRNRAAHPDELKENLKDKEAEETEKALHDDVASIQQLRDIEAQCKALADNNAALKMMIEQKDERIRQLESEKDGLKGSHTDEEFQNLFYRNKGLEK